MGEPWWRTDPPADGPTVPPVEPPVPVPRPGVTRPLRVLVVEDSPRLRARIVRALEESGITVVGQAGDGRAAIDLCLALHPDVVTMDVRLPVVTGVAATGELMRRCPTPILIVSAASDRHELVNTFDALAAGAVDVLAKPGRGHDDRDWDRRLVAAVRMVARIHVVTRFREATPQAPEPLPRAVPVTVPPLVAAPVPPPLGLGPGRGVRVVGIGASTGGPAAVATVLAGLPPSFALPVLLVMHVSESFGPPIVNWLTRMCRRPVRLAEDAMGPPVVGGTGALRRPLGRREGTSRATRRRASCSPPAATSSQS